MGHWGLAMSYIKLLWGEDDIGAARKALGTMPDPDKLTPREQAWVMAAIALVKAPDVRTSRQAFVGALEQINAQFPDDESATFLAIGLLSTIRPGEGDDTAIRHRAAGLARSVFARNPKHPGAAHYVIHALDTPELAPRALAVAKAYAAIAPEAFHAQHMPAHIFSRRGMWDDAIKSCHAAWDASIAAAREHSLSADHHDWHSLSWLVEMPFELGHEAEAEQSLKLWGETIQNGLNRQFRGLYASEVASFMQRSGAWSRADELLAPLSAPAAVDDDHATSSHCGSGSAMPAAAVAPSVGELQERAVVLDTRTLAAVMQRDAKASGLIKELAQAYAGLDKAMRASGSAQAALIAAQHERHIGTLRARLKGDDRALVKLLRAAQADAAAEAVGESNPTAFVIDDDIGDALLRLGDGKGAGEAYARALAEHPGRARSLLASARAAAKRGDTAAARDAYARLLEQWKTADAGIDGLDEARAAVAAK
jgi:hypothetical protein